MGAAWDVIVAGAGPAGWSAAVAAAREGARVLLVERYGFLGGMDTLAFSYQFNIRDIEPHLAGPAPLGGPIFEDVVSRLLAVGGTVPITGSPGRTAWRDMRYQVGVPVDPEALKIVLLELMQDAGVELLLHGWITGVTRRGPRITGLEVATKGGRLDVHARVFVDATGDGDVCALAGVPFDQDSEPCSATLMWVMANVDIPAFMPHHSMEAIAALQLRAMEAGELAAPEGWKAGDVTPVWRPSPTFPAGSDRLRVPYPMGLGLVDPGDASGRTFRRRGEVRVWASHVRGVDATDPWALSLAEVKARLLLRDLSRFLQTHVPGFAEAYVGMSGVQVGVLESRRIVGDYVLSEDDTLRGARFPDAIARCRLIVFPQGYGHPHRFGPVFEVPYRCLLPTGVDNLLAAGRCISHDRKVAKSHSLKFSGTSAAVGQAAGTAAGLAARQGGSTRSVDVRELRARLPHVQ